MAVLQVFIDTNVLLRFYSYSDDALTEIEKLTALVQAGEIRLLPTRQVLEEWARNRDKELQESFKRLSQIGATSQIPRFALHLAEASQLSDLLKQVKSAKTALVSAIDKEVEDEGLRADRVIQQMFELSGVNERSNDVIGRARLRKDLGNPPGKSESLGDQINWEILLDTVEAGADLHIVSQDGDFKSVAFDGQPSFFLKEEWRRAKGAELHLYSGLAEFTKAHFPAIKVPSDALRAGAIKKLLGSGSFYQTHTAIAELSPLVSELSREEGITLLVALTANSQISDIITDEDVSSFYEEVHNRFFLDTSLELDKQLEGISSELFSF